MLKQEQNELLQEEIEEYVTEDIAESYNKDLNKFDQYEIMKKCGLFDGFSKEECYEIWQVFKPMRQNFAKGETVFDENDIINKVGLIESGTFVGSKVSNDGNEHLISVYLPNELIGLEIVCTPSRKNPMTIYATAPGKIWWFAENILHDILNRTNIKEKTLKLLLINVINLMGNENVKKLHKISFLTQKNLKEKILAYLMHIMKKRKSNTFSIHMNREQLAQYLDINRSTLSNELSKMQKDGLISFRKNSFTLHLEEIGKS